MKVLLCLAIVAAYLLLAVPTIFTTAPTSDEGPHLAAGFVALTTGSRELNPEHPPFVKMLAALPLLKDLPPADSLQDWSGVNQWDYARQLFFAPDVEAARLFAEARLVMLVFPVLLLITAFLWGSQQFGILGGAAASGLLAACPIFVAHGRLVATDVPLAALGFLCAFLVHRFTKAPRAGRAVAAGVLIGLTLSAKFSAVVLLAGIFLAYLCSPATLGIRKKVSGMLLMTLTAALTVGVIYGSVFAPREYLRGLEFVGANHERAYSFYLLGAFRPGGFWYYFPAAFLLKATPLVVLLSLVLVMALLSRARMVAEDRSIWPFIYLPGLLYAVFICAAAPNIGVRYLIPALPYLYLALGGMLASIREKRRALLTVSGVLALQLGFAFSAFADPISYTNGLLGCTNRNAYLCLDDSNLDWGQDLYLLAKEVAEVKEGRSVETAIMYFGSADLNRYFSNWRWVEHADMSKPKPIIYAFSLHILNRSNAFFAVPNGVDWFRDFKPARRVGNTYVIYDFSKR